jgi:hypothetical protein
MSVVTEVLDRLSGVAVVREKLDETARRIDKIGEWLLDHERRLTTLEASTPALAKRKPTRKR